VDCRGLRGNVTKAQDKQARFREGRAFFLERACRM
jgi:hypothetical protein